MSYCCIIPEFHTVLGWALASLITNFLFVQVYKEIRTGRCLSLTSFLGGHTQWASSLAHHFWESKFKTQTSVKKKDIQLVKAGPQGLSRREMGWRKKLHLLKGGERVSDLGCSLQQRKMILWKQIWLNWCKPGWFTVKHSYLKREWQIFHLVIFSVSFHYCFVVYILSISFNSPS